ncbi:MAG TPA: FimV/HubP family polar landmark protein, partial [Steroidobacteraceae bacterium]|nr:FimV/HubP family polar landmark protein [Steroidobacteraceae bacterium]
VDVDLFGEPAGERSPHEPAAAKDADETAVTSESPRLHGDTGLDFVLDSPERGADETPTREMPQHDEPTVESDMLPFAEQGQSATDSATTESPALADSVAQRLAATLPATNADQTAEVSIDDLGLDLDALERTGNPAASESHLEQTDHPSDAPTMIAGLDERSQRTLADAENRTQDHDLTELERELEASFIADLDTDHAGVRTAVIPTDAAATEQMSREPRAFDDTSATSRVPSLQEHADADSAHIDPDSTSKLRSIDGEGLDLDLDRLAGALGGDTVEQPRAVEDLFSSQVFDDRAHDRSVDLDVGEPLAAGEGADTKTLAPDEATMPPMDGDASTEFEPVTMSEVGTKLDLARAYMDMGDPEGARSILDEVVQEGSASQKQEAQRLLQTLPG